MKRFRYVEVLDPWDISTFNHTRDRLRLRGDFPTFDQTNQPAGTVHFDMYLQAVGDPHVTKDISGGQLYYEEYWDEARLVGTIDGHGLAGKATTQLSGRVSFYVSGYVRA
ncbi:hypothetical protein G5V58_02625 [Nocardioides anomalus]|uniref:Uncharacterized protein n=1 Tax=Nocardioides anomalus TaxID=2712223 RepID=A0A6G6W902_9ACTN|nr:hypothetical protein [Nocardioides anomalus]QIG41818.1 hypothetical protein G5V58_02625 [Nocardioides anomalus]